MLSSIYRLSTFEDNSVPTTKCLEGVSYYYSGDTLAVKYKTDGSVAVCE